MATTKRPWRRASEEQREVDWGQHNGAPAGKPTQERFNDFVHFYYTNEVKEGVKHTGPQKKWRE